MPIPIIYHIQDPWERDWIDAFLASHDDLEHIIDTKKKLEITDAIYVSKLRDKEDLDFLARLGHRGRIGLFHASDEHYYGYYQAYSFCNAVVRNYHSPFLEHERIRQVSLYASRAFEAPHPRMPMGDRENVWGFIGRLNVGGRNVMADVLAREFEGLLSQTTQWGDTESMSPTDYRAALETCIFAPCPAGNVMAETIRLYEALQCGCIPIVYHRRHFNYFRRFYGETPLLYISDWTEAPNVMRKLLSNPERLNETAAACQAWWADVKAEMAGRYAAFLEDFRVGPKLDVNRLLARGALTRTVTHALNSDRPARTFISRLRHELTVSTLRQGPSLL